MMEILIKLHTNLFYYLYSLPGKADEFRFWLYIIAEEIDVYVVGLSILFIIAHQHKRNKNKPELLSHRSIKEAVFILGSVLVAWAISYIMKISLMMPRPYIRFAAEVLPLFPYGGFDSFPSGHATLFAGLAAALYVNHKKIGLVFGILAFMISLARVISGVHFPIDIVVGWVIGVGSVRLVHYYFMRKKN